MASRRGDVLAGVPLFSGLSKRHLRRLADMAEEVEFAEGATMAVEGEPGDTFYVILEGRARVRRGNRTVARVSSGDYFGEVSLIDGGPRTATVDAETHIDALALSRKDFREMVDREPQVVVKILNELATRLRQAERPLPS